MLLHAIAIPAAALCNSWTPHGHLQKTTSDVGDVCFVSTHQYSYVLIREMYLRTRSQQQIPGEKTSSESQMDPEQLDANRRFTRLLDVFDLLKHLF